MKDKIIMTQDTSTYIYIKILAYEKNFSKIDDCHLLHGFMQYGGECGQRQALLGFLVALFVDKLVPEYKGL